MPYSMSYVARTLAGQLAGFRTGTNRRRFDRRPPTENEAAALDADDEADARLLNGREGVSMDRRNPSGSRSNVVTS